MLRVTAGRHDVPVGALVALGELFGFSGNAVRVAVTRLVSRGLLTSARRGSYRLAPGAAPLNRLIDEWRCLHPRTRPWNGRWLAILHPVGAPRADRTRSIRAMERFGFRAGRENVWVRPDNLARRRPVVADRIRSLGMLDDAELITADGFSARTTARWSHALWPVDALLRGYHSALCDIERSTGRARSAAPGDMLVETFLIGGATIRLLALDPLLPDALCPGAPREQLTRAMLAYDRLGRSIWTKALGGAHRLAAPTRLSA